MKEGDVVDVKKRIDEVLKKYGWTRYRLSKEGEVPETTLSNIFNRNTTPTLATIELICKTLNISLSQFFTDNEMIELTPELKEFYETWLYLTPEKRQNILQTMKFMK